jgi:hypothetical protein
VGIFIRRHNAPINKNKNKINFKKNKIYKVSYNRGSDM